MSDSDITRRQRIPLDRPGSCAPLLLPPIADRLWPPWWVRAWRWCKRVVREVLR